MATKKSRESTASPATFEEFKQEYEALVPTLEKLRKGLVEQLGQVVKDHSLTLAFPIESRIKSWASIQEKIERKSLDPKSIAELPDLVGIRVVLLFLRDLRTGCKAVTEIFSVKEMEDVAGRLGDAQFGYQSIHYGITIPDNWKNVPTLSGCNDVTAELQVRTIAQHTWAAASHILQYKHESNIPTEVRRSINRVSALLETVDLEFERALQEREEYREESADARSEDELLNVDLLESTLDLLLPMKNKIADETYDTLLMDLNTEGIKTLGELKTLIEHMRDKALAFDSKFAARSSSPNLTRISGHPEQGVYFSHVGLVRVMLPTYADKLPE